ncbi:hypothetical protein Rsub_09405 [Raphidocelis subcapitata]|uniref:Uncharacterized protein n=1 Tax=Raphidocelis subcapitata TaxID=307507 RepID=A0A2V0PH24_9CHLO|nr:hypothetical protein Rsub_09405 [Raphidocelis subcapitata]|eukprot:GBF96335.1 hypothetical protein Rsub_09405 [Raphidocelis subcapitata]
MAAGGAEMPAQADVDRMVRLAMFHEEPSLAAAAAALALYLAVTLAVTAVTVRTRAWFMLTVSLTGALEALGFVMRILLLTRTPTLMLFIQMEAFLVIPPVLLAIVEYICTGRLLAALATRHSAWVARLFTASDLLCLALQGAGGALCAAPATAQTGTRLLLVGLSLQLGFFTAFTAITVGVHRRSFARDAAARPLFACLYATISLLYVRNIFRVVEFGMGYHGYLKTHEAFFYAFDFAPLFTCFLFFTFMHYGTLLPAALAPRLPLVDASPRAARGKGAKPGGGGALAVPQAAAELVVVRCGDA